MPPSYNFVVLTESDRLFETSAFSDYTIQCRDKLYKVHKSIISACPAFECALKHDFKVRTSTSRPELTSGVADCHQENHANIFTMDDDDPIAVEHLLKHLYGFSHPAAESLSFEAHCNIFVLATKYMLPSLKGLAKAEIDICLHKSSPHPEPLDDKCIACIKLYLHMTAADKDLESSMIRYLRKHYTDLLLPQYRNGLEQTFVQCPGLGVAVLTDALANPSRLEPVTRLKCGPCGKTIDETACVQSSKGINFCIDCVRKTKFDRHWFAAAEASDQ